MRDLLDQRNFGPVATAFVVSAILAYPIYLLLLRMKSRQTVSEYLPGHQKKQGTPTMGGLIVVAGLVAGMAYGGPAAGNAALLLVLFALIGFADDFLVPRLTGKRGLGWVPKIIAQLAAVALCASVDFDFGRLAWSMRLPQFALTAFVILFCANAYNFADGLDWLAGGLAIWIAIGFWASSMIYIIWPALLIASLIPFMFMNRPPARIFMGDVGSLPIGALLGLMTLRVLDSLGHYVGSETWKFVLGAILLNAVLIVELVPVPLQIASVKLRKKRLFPKTPIHHALEDRGWSEGKIVAAFWSVQIVCSALAVWLLRSIPPESSVFG